LDYKQNINNGGITQMKWYVTTILMPDDIPMFSEYREEV